jgi:hypothetical protein
VDKVAKSTFFPESWSEARILYEVSEAYKNGLARGKSPKTSFKYGSPSGFEIQFHWNPKTQKTTFYPTGK